MNRILLVLLLFAAYLSGCSKSNDVAAQVKAQGVIDDNLISTYLKSNNLPVNRVDTTGVCYVIDTLGTGNALYTSSTTVTVGYTGTLLNKDGSLGIMFANSGTTFHPSFVLGDVIKGWQLGIPNVKQGGTITLYIPSRYAYGPYPQAQVGLPANAVLIFNITIYNITN
jgi:FKBP-type peptidyl-prolyl cis-trans isomerase FkpA